MSAVPARPWFPVALFVLVACVIGGGWWVLGTQRPLSPSPLAPGEKVYCISYAPFRADQTPFDPATRISAAQIRDDLKRLSQLTDCVRTYSLEFGLDQVPEIAREFGMKVLLGLWLSSHPDKNEAEVRRAIDLAKRFPDVLLAIVVGNEVLLRGELGVPTLINFIRAVKAQAGTIPVTYADVWEFWLRYRDVAGAVDFITIHILPYWEDFPIAAEHAGAHVESIRRQVASIFPDKDILVGEAGWPSAGRMRGGALPSPVNQARVISDTLAVAKRAGFRVNLVEAFDQPWKRQLEGTVGGHWGLFDASREQKFVFGEAVSNHPRWQWQAVGGVLLALAILASAAFAGREHPPRIGQRLGVAAIAVVAGFLIGLTAENLPLESLGAGGWARSLALAAVAVAAPVVGAVALASGIGMPSFEQVLARADERIKDPVALTLGVILMATTLLAVQAALGLVFDPRYRDFVYAPLTAAAVPFAILSIFRGEARGTRPLAEFLAASALALCAVYIVINETLANWQALWLCLVFAALAVTLARVRDAQG